MDRGVWQATVYGVGLSTHTHTHSYTSNNLGASYMSATGRHAVDTEVRQVRTLEGSNAPGQTWTRLALAPDSGSA